MLRFFSYYLLIGLVTASVTLGFHLYYRKTLERPYSKKSLAFFFPFEVLFWPLFFIAALSRGSFKPVLEQSKSFRLPKPMPIDPEEERRRIAFRQGVYKNRLSAVSIFMNMAVGSEVSIKTTVESLFSKPRMWRRFWLTGVMVRLMKLRIARH